MIKTRRSLSSHWKWLSLFGLWSLFLTGFFANFVGSPGVLQAVRLNSLLESKKSQLAELQSELQRLHAEARLLEGNRFAQEKEVRRVLGYAAHDELLFDFSALDSP